MYEIRYTRDSDPPGCFGRVPVHAADRDRAVAEFWRIVRSWYASQISDAEVAEIKVSNVRPMTVLEIKAYLAGQRIYSQANQKGLP